jgi:DNA-binding transcriptional LysR family regulator
MSIVPVLCVAGVSPAEVVPEGMALPHIAKGRLKRILENWGAPYSGYHLYYPSHRQPTPAFALLVDALRYRG